MPAGSTANTNRPSRPETEVRARPVSGCRSVRLTPGTTPPDVSSTVPVSVAVVCAAADPAPIVARHAAAAMPYVTQDQDRIFMSRCALSTEDVLPPAHRRATATGEEYDAEPRLASARRRPAASEPDRAECSHVGRRPALPLAARTGGRVIRDAGARVQRLRRAGAERRQAGPPGSFPSGRPQHDRGCGSGTSIRHRGRRR